MGGGNYLARLAAGTVTAKDAITGLPIVGLPQVPVVTTAPVALRRDDSTRPDDSQRSRRDDDSSRRDRQDGQDRPRNGRDDRDAERGRRGDDRGDDRSKAADNRGNRQDDRGENKRDNASQKDDSRQVERWKDNSWQNKNDDKYKNDRGNNDRYKNDDRWQGNGSSYYTQGGDGFGNDASGKAKQLGNNRSVGKDEKPGPTDGKTVHFTEGVTPATSRISLKTLFGGFGTLDFCWVPPPGDRADGAELAYVKFAAQSSAEAAMAAVNSGQIFLDGVALKAEYRATSQQYNSTYRIFEAKGSNLMNSREMMQQEIANRRRAAGGGGGGGRNRSRSRGGNRGKKKRSSSSSSSS